MIPYFQALGERLERAWLDRSYDEGVFSRLAQEVLEQEPPDKNVDVKDIVNTLLEPHSTVQQPDQGHIFGEPPVMLFQAPRFYIEALFWFSGTTDIHEHAFSGAFSVLAGSSVHSHWSFTPERHVNSRMILGRLSRISTDILRPGDLHPINPGDQLIHQLFHLDRPSVTIVVRTVRENHHLPQYMYLPPGLAIDPEGRDPLRTRRLVLLENMAKGDMEELQAYASKLVSIGDLETLYYAFSVLSRRSVDATFLEELYSIAVRRYGDAVNLFREVYETERRIRVVTSLRSKVSDPEARFLLALLMLMPDKESVLEVMKLHIPDKDPLVTIEKVLGSISGKETIGFDFNDTNRIIFRALVEGLDSEGLLNRLRAEYRSDSLDANRERLAEHAKRMANSVLLYPLVSGSPLREGVWLA